MFVAHVSKINVSISGMKHERTLRQDMRAQALACSSFYCAIMMMTAAHLLYILSVYMDRMGRVGFMCCVRA